MHKEGHVGAALLVYAPVGFLAILLAGTDLAFLGGAVAVGLAMAPDIDMRVPLVKHRGITHTALFALVVGPITGTLGVLAGLEGGLLDGIGLGLYGLYLGTGTVASHIAADAITPAGVRPFWPLRNAHYSFGLTRAANPIANYLFLGLGVIAIGLAIAMAGAIQ